jgi:hypothetical protein
VWTPSSGSAAAAAEVEVESGEARRLGASGAWDPRRRRRGGDG